MDIYSVLSSISNNAHYLKRYIKFIESCNGSGKIKHHICPKAKDMFPQYSSLKTNAWNCALLTDRQHFIAHLILWKAFNNRSQCYAFRLLNNLNFRNKSSKVYSSSIESARKMGFSKEHKTNLSIAQQNRKPFTEEHKTNMSNSAKLVIHEPFSSEHKINLSKSWINRPGFSDIHLENLSRAAKARPQLVCPHCNKESNNAGAMKQWHFDNCKLFNSV